MLDHKYDFLPEDMTKRGIDLSKLGIHEYAWKYDDVEDVIRFLQESGVVVLGGDVYRVVNGKIEITCDSWYVDKEGAFYTEGSHETAMLYINNYVQKNGKSYIFSLVF